MRRFKIDIISNSPAELHAVFQKLAASIPWIPEGDEVGHGHFGTPHWFEKLNYHHPIAGDHGQIGNIKRIE